MFTPQIVRSRRILSMLQAMGLLLAWSGLVIRLCAQPANDNFVNAQVIPSLATDVGFSGSTYRATVETGEPEHDGVKQNRSVWYQWTPQFSGTVQLTLTHYGLGLGVYTGGSLGSLVQVALDRSQISPRQPLEFVAQAGVPYSIAVWEEVRYVSGAQFTCQLHQAVLSLACTPDAPQWFTGTPVTFAVQGPQVDWMLTSMELRSGTNVLATRTSAPWEFTWTFDAVGEYAVKAVGIDIFGYERHTQVIERSVVSGNDDFAAAAPVHLTNGTTTCYGRDAFATAEPGEPSHGGAPAGRSLWWSWVPEFSGRASVQPSSSEWGQVPRWGVYHGSDVAQLTAEPVDTNGTFAVVAGQPLTIALDGGQGAPSTVAFILKLDTVVLNPVAAGRHHVGDTVILSATNHFDAGGDGVIQFTIWNPGGSYDSVSTNEPFQVPLHLAQAGYYQLSASASNTPAWTSQTGPMWLAVTPSHDRFDHPQSIPGAGTYYSSAAVLTSAEPGEPAHGGEAPAHTLWWSWTATVKGRASVSRSPANGMFAVYTGNSLGTLQRVADSHDGRGLPGQSPVRFDVVPGTTYRLAFDVREGSNPADFGWTLEFVSLAFAAPSDGVEIPFGHPLQVEIVDHNPLLQPYDLRLFLFRDFWYYTQVQMAAGERTFLWDPPSPGNYTLDVIGYYHDWIQPEAHIPEPVHVRLFPTNDYIASASALAPIAQAWWGQGSTMACTYEPFETPVTNSHGTAWHTWTVPGPGTYAVTFDSAPYNRQLSISRGTGPQDLQPVTAAGPGLVARLALAGGEHLWLTAFGAPGEAAMVGGPYEITASLLPPNDRVANASPLTFFPLDAVTRIADFGCTNTHATLEPAEALIPDLAVFTNWYTSGTLWWQWTAPSNGLLWVESLVPWSDAQPGIYTGDTESNLATLAWRFAVVKPGVAYRIGVSATQSLTPGGTTFQGRAWFLPGTASPTNDSHASPTILAGDHIVLTNDTTFATTEDFETGLFRASVWYSWTAAHDGLLVARASSTGFTPSLTLFRPGTNGVLDVPLVGPEAGLVDQRVLAGETFLIRVAELPVASFAEFHPAPFVLELTNATPARPSNDIQAGAIPITTPSWTAQARIDGAIASAQPEARGGALWWRYTATEPCSLRADLVTADMPAAVSLFLDPQGEVSAPVDPPVLAFTSLAAGQTCYVAVSSPKRLVGAFQVKVRVLFARQNDLFSNRSPVTGTQALLEGSFAGATREPSEPVPYPDALGRSLWWSWTAPADGRLFLSQGQGMTGWCLAIYRGNTLATLENLAVAPSWWPSAILPVEGGVTYQISADPFVDNAAYVAMDLKFLARPQTVGPISLSRADPDGTLVWRIHGADQFPYVVQWSDLSGAWTDMATIYCNGGTAEFVDWTFPRPASRMFRVRLDP